MTAKKGVLTVRVQSATKKEAARVFEKLGLDLSSGVNLYLARVARDQAVPFQLFAGNRAGICPTCGRRFLGRIHASGRALE
jgi:addiction module RelB/DinJ family antitoxin